VVSGITNCIQFVIRNLSLVYDLNPVRHPLFILVPACIHPVRAPMENSFDAADLAFLDFKQFRNLPGPWFDGAGYPVSSAGSPKIARFACRVVEETKTE